MPLPKPPHPFFKLSTTRVDDATTLKPRSAQTVVMVLSAWLAIVGNWTLWRALLRIGGIGELPLMGGVAIVILAATAAFFAFFAWSRFMKPLWVAMLIAAAVAQHFMFNYGAVIDATMIANTAQTDLREVRDLLTWPLLLNLVVVAFMPALWLVWQPVTRPSAWRQIMRNVVLFSAGFAIAAGGIFAMYSELAPLVRNNLKLRYMLNPLGGFYAIGDMALKPFFTRSTRLEKISGGALLGPSYARQAKTPLLVIVVGETARSDHFALNGYARNTTPELAAEGVYSYPDAHSCGTNTFASVPCMFSSLGKNGYENRKSEVENLLDVLQAAGLAVLWIDNQAGCKGVCDRVAHASTADDVKAGKLANLCDGNECLDEALLVGLDARVAALPAERRQHGVVIVMHQMGSHGPAYSKRSPPAYKRFLPECTTNTLADCEHDALINAYDNSIVYTDHVLASTIAWLQSKSNSTEGSLFYMSDHGESLGEYGVFLHGVPYAIAPDAQTHVPLVAWFAADRAPLRQLDRTCVARGLGARVSHDNLYHSVMGLLDVRSPTYRVALDIWAPCRGSAPR